MEQLSDYDYKLPLELIAQTPLEDRSASRLLLLRKDTGRVEHRNFRDVTELLQPGDLLILNNTRVTAIRLLGRRPSGGGVEALLLAEREPGVFDALVKPGKKLKIGSSVSFPEDLVATVEADGGEGFKTLRFESGAHLHDRLAACGFTPLPPYITEQLQDPERYQTVYGTVGGSAAAPTAGLHFTPEMLADLTSKGIETAAVTLDVGIDTFRPVQSTDLSLHRMHGERCVLAQETAYKIEKCTGRIIAVGTTTVRTLETFAVGTRKVEAGERLTQIFIKPGHRFQVVDGMFTNFHLPRTTMLMMISAMAGREPVLRAYDAAVKDRYRFLSFGDSMLII